MDISLIFVKMVELVDNGKGGYWVECYVIEFLLRDVVMDGNIVNFEGVVDMVCWVWKWLGIMICYVVMVLFLVVVIIKKIVFFGYLCEQEMEIQVEFEVNQYILFVFEEVNLDFQVIGLMLNSLEDVEVMIVVLCKEKIEDCVVCVEVVDLCLIVMDVEFFVM